MHTAAAAPAPAPAAEAEDEPEAAGESEELAATRSSRAFGAAGGDLLARVALQLQSLLTIPTVFVR